MLGCCRWDDLHISDAANRKLAQRIYDGKGGYTTPGSLSEALGFAKMGPIDEQGEDAHQDARCQPV
jgi:hypothetical protein